MRKENSSQSGIIYLHYRKSCQTIQGTNISNFWAVDIPLISGIDCIVVESSDRVRKTDNTNHREKVSYIKYCDVKVDFNEV